MLKKTLAVIGSLCLLFLVLVAGIVIRERFFMHRYKQTELTISVEQLKEIWGEPHTDLINSTYTIHPRVLIYQTGFAEYAFSFDKKGKLVSKYEGD